jgi:putative transcriptional regulator
MTTHDDDVDGELLADLLGATAVAPSAGLKDRLLKSASAVTSAQRYATFVDRIAQLTDLAKDKANDLLNALDDAARWVGGGTETALFHVDGGPRVANAIVGFVRMREGAQFIEHEHVGDEVMLILQGGLVMNGKTYRAGDEIPSKGGTSHSFVAAPGPDLMYLGVIQGGMKIEGNLIGPNDPKY